MQIKEFQSEENAGERIDKFLTEKVSELSRSYIQKLIKEKNVKVNSTVIKSNYKVAKGDQIQITIPDLTEPDILPENIPLDILYEDDDILVVNKPKGMVVHPAAGHYTGTLVDMDTTGSLLVCKNDTAHQILAEQLKEHSIKRIYHAIVHGNIKEDSGTVNAPIGRHPIDRKKMSINEKNGRNAVTHYRVLERFGEYTYIACELETGRTHQIRVHMASIHHPLLGDCVYGPAKCPWTLQGQTLHAKILGIIHPRTGKYMEFDAPLPEYFENLLKKLRKMS